MKNKSSKPPAKGERTRKQRATTFLFTAPYIIWMCIFILIPLGVVFFYAMTDANTGLFTLTNLGKVFSPAFMKIFGRSIWYSLLASAICLVIGYPVAYFIARQKPSVQRTLYLLVMPALSTGFWGCLALVRCISSATPGQ